MEIFVDIYPCTCQRKYSASMIWRGADHNMLRKVVRSMNLCASTDIRFTTSPTVDERLAALVITSACSRIQWGKKQKHLQGFSVMHPLKEVYFFVNCWEVSFYVLVGVIFKPTVRTWPAYLPVDGADDSCAYVHAGDKTVLEVMVKNESLQESCEEHEERQRVAPPIWNACLFGERNQHPGKGTQCKYYHAV